MWIAQKVFAALCTATFLSSCSGQKGLRTLLEWKELEYSFPSNTDRQQAISQGLYVHGNGVPIDTDVHYGANDMSRVFVTIPRFTTGIPFSLATVTNLQATGGPQLQAYPDYTWHSSHGQDCMGITSVFRVAVDECERLWVADTGRIGNVQYCSPQLLIFNLKTDKLIRRYVFPQDQFKTAVSLFVTTIVDIQDPPPRGMCRKSMAYIADVTGFGILVYDFETNMSWRLENKLMYPYPEYGTFTIAGESFDLMDGILGLSLTPAQKGGRSEPEREAKYVGGTRPGNNQPRTRYLYFHSLASVVENRIPLDLVNNRSIWMEHQDALPRKFVTLGSRGTQSAASAVDSRGNMYFGLMDDIAIGAWNVYTPYHRNNMRIVAQDSNTLQFISGLKIKRSRRNTEELWALSCRFQKVFTGSKSSEEVNFRILGCNVDELLNGGCRNVIWNGTAQTAGDKKQKEKS